jgi:hypothetical protein
MTSTQPKQYDGPKPDFCTLTGLAMYAKVFEPAKANEQYNIPPRWTIDLLLDKETQKTAEARGLALKHSNEKYKAFCESQGLNAKGYDGTFITIKKPTVRKVWDKEAGTTKKDSTGQAVTEAAPRPRVVDSHGTEIPEEANLLIGNGSEVQVSFVITKPKIGDREQFGKFGGRLFETKILELVEYSPNKGSFVFDDEEDSKPKPSSSTTVEMGELDADEIPFLPDDE